MRVNATMRGIMFVLSLLLMMSELYAADLQYQIEVDGLACPFCAYGIEKQLSAVQGVERVKMHIGEGVVIVTMEDGVVLEETVANQAVKEAGFTLRGFKRISTDGAP